ncbi:MAG: hypothetical protein HY089_12500 [Ignavibacteriales bacterium]|nr:hypothetical protein [Ignavibacteriales bacterium]
MPTKPKERFFLILSTSGGAGHIRAAEGLHQTAQQSGLPIRTEHYDCLDFTSRAFKRIYSQSYLEMVNRIPELWGYLYAKTEKNPYKKTGLIKIFDHFNYQKYLAALKSFNADAIVCTHFLPYISVSSRLRKHGITAPVFAVTTDFDAHKLWIDPIVEHYFVHHQESAWQLSAKGVAKEKISITGIPLLPQFKEVTPRPKARQIVGIDEKNFTALVLSGGFGVGKVGEIVEQVAKTFETFPTRTFTALIVCGKNEKVKATLEQRQFPKNVRPKIYGFVNNIHDLMDAADVLISKSGGLTSSEAMAKHLPMIIIDPIPGQESRNADIIVEQGAGWKAMDLPNIQYKLMRIIENSALLDQAKKATMLVAKPNAAHDVLSKVLRIVDLKTVL